MTHTPGMRGKKKFNVNTYLTKPWFVPWSFFLLAIKKSLHTLKLIYHQKPEHLHQKGTLPVKNFVLPRWWFTIYTCQKGKSMAKLWLHLYSQI
jgi:hypothetical protein